MTEPESAAPVYTPKKPKYNGRVLLSRRKPFELFLKFGGGIYALHCQVHKLTVTWESRKLAKRLKKR